ncbi:MAG: ABC transporter ATP-binding protein [Tissierellales bacterium]
MDYIVDMRQITKKFGSFIANNSIDFNLMSGETHALVGENGAGKTTLMRMLYGQYQPTSGEIYIKGNKESYNISRALSLGIGMVHQNFMQIPDMSVLENIILGHAPIKNSFIDYKAAKDKVQRLLDRFNMKISLSKPIGSLSVGERQKIEIIKTLYLGANILILDEPTAVLTPQESDELFNIIEELKAEGKSVIFISHKLKEVITVADRITVLRHGKVSANYLKGEVTETDIARAMIGKKEVALFQNQSRGKLEDLVCKFEKLRFIDDDGVPKLRDLSFDIRAGEILGIGGVEGNGQTELLNSIIGMNYLSSGKIILDGKNITNLSIAERRKLGVGYVSEDRMTTGLALQADIGDNVISGIEDDFTSYTFLNKRKIDEFTAKLIEDFDIRGIEEGNPVSNLSGGNMQKIVLAREISRKPKLLLASQPTRGLDIGAINFVRKILLEEKEKGTAILLISANLEELMSLSDRMIILYEGRIAGEITSYDIENKLVSEADIGLMMGGISERKDGENDTNIQS